MQIPAQKKDPINPRYLGVLVVLSILGIMAFFIIIIFASLSIRENLGGIT
jgi:hypothetical protein|tara:strand:+ start:2169 stop:2318 length:150 start_codon:yes stop_codon:yes gene_type:complete